LLSTLFSDHRVVFVWPEPIHSPVVVLKWGLGILQPIKSYGSNLLLPTISIIKRINEHLMVQYIYSPLGVIFSAMPKSLLVG
jgi:hypothetical protein